MACWQDTWQVKMGPGVHSEPLQPVGLGRAVMVYYSGAPAQSQKLLWRQLKPEQIYSMCIQHSAARSETPRRATRLSAGSAVEEDEFTYPPR